MDPKEFILKRFETNYPEVVKLIEVWAEHSIKQNWDALSVLLNHHTVPDCPPDEFSKELQGNKRYFFFKELGAKVAEYLYTKAYTYVSRTDGDQLYTPDGKHMSGLVVRARMVTEADKKKK